MVVVAFLMCAPFARAQVLDQVPEQAMVVVKVTNIGGFSTKLGKLCTDLQLTAQLPPLADPLGALQEKLKLSNGIDKSGDAVFAFLDPSVAGGNDDNAFLLLWPVTDYKSFLGNFPDAKEDGGISEVKFADSDKPAYIANWGKYAAMSPAKEIAALKPTGIKVSGATEKEMSTKDIVLFANMAQLKAKLQPQLAKAKESALSEMDKNMSPDAAKFAPAIKALVSQFFNIADSTLRDATAATIGVSIGENGINSTTMAEFEPTSYIGTITKGLKNSDASMLTGLPAAKYLFFGGSVNDPATSTKLIDDFTAPITAELAKISDPKSDAITKYIASVRKYMLATQGQAAGWIAPTGALGQEPIFQILSIQSGDPAAMKSAYAEMMSVQQDLATAFGAPDGTIKTTTTPNAKTIEGVSFDLLHTDMNLGQGPNAAQADNTMKMIYGPDGMNALTGVVGDKLVVGFGASEQTLGAAITAIKANDDPMSKNAGVAAVRRSFPRAA